MPFGNAGGSYGAIPQVFFSASVGMPGVHRTCARSTHVFRAWRTVAGHGFERGTNVLPAAAGLN